MMDSGARTLVVGVDGLDFDLVRQLRRRLPLLNQILDGSRPHESVFPPDSVPSWTTIVTGLKPEEHRQLSNVKFFLEDLSESGIQADLNSFTPECFWEEAVGDDIAVINPFLAYPPWPPKGKGAMVSGPPFAEETPSSSDPQGLLVGELPSRMGGFTEIPRQRDLQVFADRTLTVAAAQYEYAIRQLMHRRWDLFFYTTLAIDRLEHYAWRHYDADQRRSQLSEIIPRAHEQLEEFVSKCVSTLGSSDQFILLSDHGHGARASTGVNLQEVLRRKGLFEIDPGSSTGRRKAIEVLKTAAFTVAPAVRAEDLMLRLAPRIPAKKALKSGTYVGSPARQSASVLDLAGSNPFGGVRAADAGLQDDVIVAFEGIRHRGRRVVKWIARTEEALGAEAAKSDVYPELVFELFPDYGPTWNLYGPIFTRIVTRRRQSGGHTRRAVCAGLPQLPWQPRDSHEVNRLLRSFVTDEVGGL